MYQDMAARHRARFRNVQILRVAEIEKKEDVRRPYIKQLLEPGLKFPLPHRRTKSKAWYAANRPVSCLSLESPSCADDSLPGLKLDHSYRFRMYWRVRRQMHLFYDHDTGKVGDDTDEVARLSARIRAPWSYYQEPGASRYSWTRPTAYGTTGQLGANYRYCGASSGRCR